MALTGQQIIVQRSSSRL